MGAGKNIDWDADGKPLRILGLIKNIQKENTKGIEYTAITKNGKRFPILVYSNVIRRNNEAIGLRGIIVDISEHKNMLEELTIAKEKAEESDSLKSAFLANMSHEIRTPMNGILGFAELLRDPFISAGEKETYIKIIHSNGKQLLNLIDDDIIDIAKIEAGQLKINKSYANINPVLDEIYLLFKQEQTRLKKEHIDFQLEKQTNKIQIYTDTIRLKQILSNLLNNAFKFTDKGFVKLGYQIIEEKGSGFFRF